jgi:hypothetical protein
MHIALPQDSILLDGSGSTKTDQEIASYVWAKISGPPLAAIRSPTSIKTMVVRLREGSYQFELKVKDVLGQVARDTVSITVDRKPNTPPKAVAGADILIMRPTRSVLLDGRGSFDADNDIKTYLWTYINGPSAYHILNPDSSHTEVTGLAMGIYNFELSVTDSTGLFSKDTVVVTLIDNVAGLNPVLHFFCDLAYTNTTLGETELGVAAYTYDGGGIINYVYDGHYWTQLSGPSSAVFSLPDNRGESVHTTITNLVKGSYVFQLGVQFYGGDYLYDTARVEVVDDTLSGKEYIFETTWHYYNDVYESLSAETPSHPELFFQDPNREKIVLIKLQDSTEWINLSSHTNPAPHYNFIPDLCSQILTIYSQYPVDPRLAGQKLLIKLRYD